MSVTSATGTMRIVRPRRPTQTDEGQWALLLAAVVALILLFWEASVSWFAWIPDTFLPAPSAVAVSFVSLLGDPEFWSAFGFSVTNLLIGLVIAIFFGVVIGLAVGWSPVLRFMVAPFLWLLYSTPKVALAPLFILGMGLGNESKIALVVLLAIFPILLNTMEGAVTVNPSLVNAARVYDVKGLALGWKVIFPATLPYSLAGIQRGAALGFTGEVLGEFLGGTGGLGHMLEFAAYQFRMDEAIAMVVVMIIIANLTLLLISILRRRWAPWYDDRKIVG